MYIVDLGGGSYAHSCLMYSLSVLVLASHIEHTKQPSDHNGLSIQKCFLNIVQYRFQKHR